MKRILTSGSLILMLITFTAVYAQPIHNGNINHNNHPNSNVSADFHYNNQNNTDSDNHGYGHYNRLNEFRGYLVVNERDIKHNSNFGFHINLSSIHITNIDFRAGSHRGNNYGILIQKPGGGHAYYRLDRTGNRMASQMIRNRGMHKKQIYVEVKGRLDRDSRTLMVASMERIRQHNNRGWNGRPNRWG